MSIKKKIQALVKKTLGIPTGGVWLSQSVNNNPTGVGSESVYNTFAYICIMKRSNYLSSIKSIVSPPELLELIDSPNEVIGTSWNELKVLVSESLDVYGNAYLYAPRMGTPVPSQLWFMPVQKVRSVEVSGLIEQYIINGGQIVGVDEMIHFRNVSPRASWQKGVARELESVEQQNDLDVSIQRFMANHYENHAIPPLVVENSGGTLQQAQYELFKQRFSEQIPDGVISMLLEGGLSVKPLDLGFEKMMSGVSGNLTFDLQQRIAMAFGVPMSLLTGEYKYQTAEATRAEFMQTVVEPRHTYIDQVLTNYFREFYPDASFSFEPYENPEMQTPLDYFSFSAKNEKAMQIENRAEYWHKKMLTHGKSEKKISKKVQMIFNQIADEINKSYASVVAEKNLSQEIEERMSLNVDFWRKKIEESIAPDFQELIYLTIRDSMDEIGESFVISDWDKQVFELTTEAARQASMGVETINDQVSRLVLESATGSGVGYGDLKDRVAKLLSNIEGGDRASAIARTTATRAMSGAQSRSWEKKGRTYYWLTERDDRVRDSHRKMDGQEVDVAGKFTLPDGSVSRHPAGDGLPASEAINCRCILYPGRKR